MHEIKFPFQGRNLMHVISYSSEGWYTLFFPPEVVIQGSFT